jgi:hypothetical protein
LTHRAKVVFCKEYKVLGAKYYDELLKVDEKNLIKAKGIIN